jgi:hypothetical protein
MTFQTRSKNKAQASELVRRAIDVDREWSHLRKCLIFDIERPKPHEMEGKDKRARTRYTDYLTPAAVWAQECEHKVKKADEVLWKKDKAHRTKQRRIILEEALKMLPGFESVEDMPPAPKKETGIFTLSDYIQQRERIMLAESRRILDKVLDGDLVDADEIDDRLAKLDAFEADALGQIRKACASTRAVLAGLRGTRLVRAMDFTDPEEVAARVDEILAAPSVEPPASGLADWLEEIVTPAEKGNAGVTLPEEDSEQETPPPSPPSVYQDYKGNAHVTLSVEPPASEFDPKMQPQKGNVGITLPDTSETVTPSLDTMLDWALFWAGQGIRVFPLHEVYDDICTCTCTKKCKNGVHRCGSECGSKGKHPRPFNGLLNATTEAKQIMEWWTKFPTSNIGGVMGAPGNLLALDFDPKHGGDASLHDLIEAHGDSWTDTLTHRTGSGGFHFFFQYSLDIELRNSAGKVAPGVDTRGEGGYVVLPPSIHASGNSYEMMKVAVVRPVPDWLIAALKEDDSARVIDFQELKGRKTFARAYGDPFYDGTRNSGLFGVGIGRWRYGWVEDVTELHAQLLEVNAARCVPPLDDAEVAEMAAHITADYLHLRGIDAEKGGTA